jgi:dTDP-glucose pyrophosphorylase
MELQKYTVGPRMTFESALLEMDTRATQILLVVDDFGVLLGTITDGDLRRAILRKLPQDSSVTTIMNPRPIKVGEGCLESLAREIMRANRIRHLPIVGSNGLLRGLFTEETLVGSQALPLQAVLMVGGYGKRLGDMTRNCPKPMLKVGGRPILHTIVDQLRQIGVNKIHMAVNYLSGQIKDYFEDGQAFGVSISYVEEAEPLGTAGALRLLKEVVETPMLVMNGDILTRVNFADLLRFHQENNAVATMCVREFYQQVPFGVVQLSGAEILGIEEKPASRFFINSGIYVLEPCVMHYIPSSGAFGMPSLFDVLREQHKKTVAYPIHEYWMDVGNPGDFQTANESFASVFS